MRNLRDLLEKKAPLLNKEIIKVYARTRTFIRIRHLNAALEEKREALATHKKIKKFAMAAK